MLTTKLKKNKKSIRNGIIHDIVTSIKPCFSALLFESTEKIAYRAAKQYIARQEKLLTKNSK